MSKHFVQFRFLSKLVLTTKRHIVQKIQLVFQHNLYIKKLKNKIQLIALINAFWDPHRYVNLFDLLVNVEKTQIAILSGLTFCSTVLPN